MFVRFLVCFCRTWEKRQAARTAWHHDSRIVRPACGEKVDEQKLTPSAEGPFCGEDSQKSNPKNFENRPTASLSSGSLRPGCFEDSNNDVQRSPPNQRAQPTLASPLAMPRAVRGGRNSCTGNTARQSWPRPSIAKRERPHATLDRCQKRLGFRRGRPSNGLRRSHPSEQRDREAFDNFAAKYWHPIANMFSKERRDKCQRHHRRHERPHSPMLAASVLKKPLQAYWCGVTVPRGLSPGLPTRNTVNSLPKF